MTAQWMLYCLAVGGLLTLGALAAERALRAFRLPQRGVWAAALVLGLAIPAAARWLPRAGAGPAAPDGGVQATRLRLDGPAAGVENLRRFDVAVLDGPLTVAWMGLSAAAVLALLGAAAVLELRRRRWRAAEVEGVPVLVAPDTGPAVVGLFRSRIVLPEWVVRDADPDVRALLLEHEREHVRAGDPRLLALGLAAVALAPWNPAAWYGLRRLRLAMEVDCDARVLARRADVRAYGTLLLEVGRRETGGRLAAAAFSEPVSFLERRIRIMTAPRSRFPWLRAGVFSAVAAASVAVACETPGPVQTAPVPAGTRMEPVRTELSSTAEARGSGVRISRAAIDAAVRAHYPEVFTAAPTDHASLLFVIGEDGDVERHERLRMRRPGPSPHEPAQALRSRARTAMDDESPEGTIADLVTFSPGQMGPGRVEVLWMRKLSEDQMVATVEVDTVRVSGTRTRTPAPEAVAVPADGRQVTQTTVQAARVRGQPVPPTAVGTAPVSGQAVRATTVEAARVRGQPVPPTAVGTARVSGQAVRATTVEAAPLQGEPARTTTVAPARKP
ncbi:MAG TPA: M56 family metallopeptidase [Longimicrobium sp.]